jgi:hypothetical protein
VPDLPVDVVGENAAAHPDLVSGQARPPWLGNGLLQIGDQAGKHAVELVDRVTGGAEYWIAEQADGTLSHHPIVP